MRRSLRVSVFAVVSGLAGAFGLPALAQYEEPIPQEVPTEEAPPELDGQPMLEDEEENSANSRLRPLFAPNYTGEGAPEREAEPDDEDEEDAAFDYEQQPAVVLRGLDKITGRSTDFTVSSGASALFGGLRVTVRACHQSPPTEAPESVAYLEIEDYGFSIADPSELSEDIDKDKRVFHGWMFASSPGIHALEHPIYDVWVIRCTTEAPDLSSEDSES